MKNLLLGPAPLRRPLEVARSTRGSLILAAVLAALVLEPSAARADGGGTDSTTPQLQYRKAHEAIKARNWDEARRLLLDLWARSHTYDVSSSLVFVENQLGHFASAANHAAFSLRNAPPIEKPEELERLKQGLEELKARVGAVTVSVDRPGAEVLVDAEVVGTSPLPSDVYVDVGPHVVSARLGGAASAETRVDALAGQRYRVELALPDDTATSIPAPVAPDPSVSDGSYPDTQPRSRNYAPALVAAGISGAALAGSVATLVISLNKQSDADHRASQLSGNGQNECAPGVPPDRAAACSEIADLAKQATTFRNVAYVGFGVTAVAGIAMFLLWPRGHSTATAARVVPSISVSRESAFASVTGAF